MRVAYVTLYDNSDVTRMSGTGYNIARAFERVGLDLHFIGPLRMQFNPVNIARYAVNRYVWGKNDHPQRDPGFLRHYARQVEKALQGSGVDAVFGSGGLPLAYVDTDLPMIVWTDCTFAALLDYYGKFSNLSRRSIRAGHAADQNLFDRCDRVIMTSQWAADSAVNDYGFDPDRITVIPRGANVAMSRTWEQTEPLVRQRPTDRCRLLFIGADWVRKRGDLALEVVKTLNARGLPSELTVVGCNPDVDGTVSGQVNVVGYLSKATAEGRARFGQLLGQSSFLLLPTRADCTPIVLCEASAYGVPSLATRTGAVPSVIIDDKNGRLFEVDASPGDYADHIADVMADRDGYEALCRRCFDEYRTRLNWDVNGRRAADTLRQAVEERRGT